MISAVSIPVEEFWIVDLDARVFERSTPVDSRVDVLDVTLRWLPNGASVPFDLDVPDYFAQVLDL